MKAMIVASSSEELKAFSSPHYIKVVTGVGLAQAAVETAKALSQNSADIVISVGSAGSMRREHEVGSVLSFSKVYNADQDLTKYHLPRYATLTAEGSTLNAISLIGDEHILISSSSFSSVQLPFADAADMECYSVALAASAFGIKAASFKLITDIVGEHVRLADYKRILRDGRMLLAEKVKEFLKNI